MSYHSGWLRLMMYAGRVKRFHTMPTIMEHNVGHHSWGVAMILHHLYPGHPSLDKMVLYALLHDVAEAEMGDIPAHTKRLIDNDKLQNMELTTLASAGMSPPVLDESERRLVKFADCFDGMINCVNERRLGSQVVNTAFKRWNVYVHELNPGTTELTLLQDIHVMWKDANVRE